VVDSFSASTLSVLPGGTVDLAVTAHDPDCAGTCTSGCGLTIRADLTAWSATGGTYLSRNNGATGSPYSASAQWQAPAAEGSYTLRVTLYDSGTFLCGGRLSNSAQLTVLVTTTMNNPPVISALTAERNPLYIGESVLLTAEASDPDSDPIAFEWITNLGTVAPQAPGTALFQAPVEPGLAAITCKVTDRQGAFAIRTYELPVTSAMAERKLEGLAAPLRVAVDPYGYAFVVDRKAGGIVVASLASGRVLSVLPRPGVSCVAVDWNGDLLAGGDAGVAVLDRGGVELAALPPAGDLGPVADIAVDAAQHQYAVLFGRTGRIVIYDSDYRPVRSFGTNGEGTGQFRGAVSLAVHSSGEVFVADQGHGAIRVFDGAGNYLRSFGTPGSGPGRFNQLAGLSFSADGLLYATDSFQSWVQVFTAQGVVKEVLGNYGWGVGEFITATGVSVSTAYRKLVATSLNTSSLQVFNLPGAVNPSPNTAPTAAFPLSPVNEVLPHLTPTILTVENAFDPDFQSLLYAFELDKQNPQGAWALQNSWTVTEGSQVTSVDASGFTGGIGNYRWRVNVFDGLAWSGWTDDQVFQIMQGQPNRAPGVPAPLSPAGGAEVASLVPDLTGSTTTDPDNDPLNYQFEAALMLNGAPVTVASSGWIVPSGGTASWTVPAGVLGLSQQVYWRCRATDGYLYGGWSAYAMFRTAPLPAPDAAVYGNLPDGDTTRAAEVRYTLGPQVDALELYFQVFDVTAPTHLQLLVNDTTQYWVDVYAPDAWSTTLGFAIPADELDADGPNTFAFIHYSWTNPWGIRKVGLVAPPMPVLAAEAFNSVVDLSWSTATPAEAGSVLRLYRGPGPDGPYSPIGDYAPGLARVRDTGLTNGLTYWYTAAFVDAEGNEGRSAAPVAATPLAGLLTPVTDLRVSKKGNDAMLTWTPVTTADGLQLYEVYRDAFGLWEEDTGSFSNRVGVQINPATGEYADPGALLQPAAVWYSVVPLTFSGERALP
jgi:hypothetical protein